MIKATENLSLGELISRRVPFIVPKYQRPYAWNEDEVTDFCKDLNDLYEARVNDPAHPKKHFFGGLVSVNRDAPNTFTGRSYDVVDGQQRLATIMITVALLIKGLEEVAKQAEAENDLVTAQAARSHADTTTESMLEYKEVVNSQIQSQIRLKLSKIDAVFFENLIRDRNHPKMRLRESHQKLQNAWKLINKQLIRHILDKSGLCLSDKLKHLLVLRSCITEDCHIIHIVSDDLGEAFRLFAVLNDRGRSLSDADLLRVHTLELLEHHPTEQDHVEHYWDNILELKDTEVGQFLRAYYSSHKGERASSRDFVDSFSEQFFYYKRPLQLVQAVELDRRIASMQEESQIFLDISEGRWPYENSTINDWERSRLYYLVKTLKHTLCIPLLMSAYQGLAELEFAKLISILERFVFRYINMVGAHAGSLGDLYYKQAVNIRQIGSGYNITTLQLGLTTLQRNSAGDELFEEAMKQKLSYDQAARTIIRYFLTTIEYYLPWYRKGHINKPTADMSRVFDVGRITLEHIQPQKPAIQDNELEPFKHDIGNLTFWGPNENTSAGNIPFVDKRDMYRNSMVLLNQELARLAIWDKNALEDRRQELIEIAKKVFSA